LIKLSILSSLLSTCNASIGDRSPAYQRCITSCTQSQCTRSSSSSSSSSPPRPADSSSSSSSSFPFSQYHTSPLWSCESTCSYACQQILTDLSLSRSSNNNNDPLLLEGLPIGKQVQFHGKWSFHRLDLSSSYFPFWLFDYLVPRAQEPFSVLFSFLNFYYHWKGFKTLRTLSRGITSSGGGSSSNSKGARTFEGKKLAKVYLVYSTSGLIAWIGSIVFHTRDNSWTEKLDYFGAGGTTLVGLWCCIIRISGLYSTSTTSSTSSTFKATSSPKRYKKLLTTSLTVLYLLHISYLSFRNRFNYSYNMKINIFVSILTIFFWLYWVYLQSSLPSPSNFSRRQLSSYPSARTRFRAPHHLDPLLPLFLLPSLTLFEVLDFPPVGFPGTRLRLLDSHAIWHLSTVIVVKWWYDFLIKDVNWIDGQGSPPSAINSLSSDKSKVTPNLSETRGNGFKES